MLNHHPPRIFEQRNTTVKKMIKVPTRLLEKGVEQRSET